MLRPGMQTIGVRGNFFTTEAPCFVGQLPVKLDAVRQEQ